MYDANSSRIHSYQYWPIDFPPCQQLNLKTYEISIIKEYTYFLPVGSRSELSSPRLRAANNNSMGAAENEYGPV